jgi:D-alanyl-D-alanine carboxypeptidase
MNKKRFMQVFSGIVLSLAVPAAQAGALGTTVLINRTHPLQPRAYVPPSLSTPSVLLAEPAGNTEMEMAPVAAENITVLFKAALTDGIRFVFASGYRPYTEQASLFTNSSGHDTEAGELVAPPGFSEHQSGLAADLILLDRFCPAEGCFALSRGADWLNQNAYKYGFIVRYPLYKESSTGYEYEPWHLRYVGVSLAAQLHERQETLEEFYGLP